MNEIGRISPRVREQLIQQLKTQGISNIAVLEAIRNIPRHKFVEEALIHRAYDNAALPIGNRQTISQPYIVALMTEALLEGGNMRKVLEIGSGSGYQTAILARLVPEVYTVERISAMIPPLTKRLQTLDISNVHIKHGDGKNGWEEESPFDGIIVTAASVGVPTKLYEQLEMGGKIIIPLVGKHDEQNLVEVIKTGSGHKYNFLEHVRFVPMLAGEV